MSRQRAWIAQLPGDCPITWGVLGANALTFASMFVANTSWGSLVFDSPAFPLRVWTAVTYPLVGAGGIWWLLFGGYVFWLFGGSLERAWGWRDYTVFLLLVSGSTAIALWVANVITSLGVVVAGFGMPLGAITVAWAIINPAERVLLYFVLPVEARWLGILAAVFVLFSLRFPLGVFALAGCGVAWWYVRRGRYLRLRHAPSRSRLERRERAFTLNPLALYRRWRMKRQFTRLIRGSKGEGDDQTLH